MFDASEEVGLNAKTLRDAVVKMFLNILAKITSLWPSLCHLKLAYYFVKNYDKNSRLLTHSLSFRDSGHGWNYNKIY